MRLKNVPYAKEKINNSIYVIKNPESFYGRFHSLFDNDKPIHLEIGTGKGDFIIGMALKHPNINFIGIEKYDSVLVRAIEKLEELNISNLLFIRMDALNIENIFHKEIDTLYLNFSDPWPKNRHTNRRLTSPLFLTRYENIFQNKCHVIQKTDNQDLFVFSLLSFNNMGYRFKALTFDLHNSQYVKDNIQTEYETKFVSKGMPIYYVDCEK